tara:strand:+ start:143 stop:502 length:360 start_codon:yes stop_codon:yes gene_type:complete
MLSKVKGTHLSLSLKGIDSGRRGAQLSFFSGTYFSYFGVRGGPQNSLFDSENAESNAGINMSERTRRSNRIRYARFDIRYPIFDIRYSIFDIRYQIRPETSTPQPALATQLSMINFDSV